MILTQEWEWKKLGVSWHKKTSCFLKCASILLATVDSLIIKVNGIVLSKSILKTGNLFWVHWFMGVQAEIIHRNCYPMKCCTHTLFWTGLETKYEGKLKRHFSPDGDMKIFEANCLNVGRNITLHIKYPLHLLITAAAWNIIASETALLYVYSKLNGSGFDSKSNLTQVWLIITIL